jgi:hypothetical protein
MHPVEVVPLIPVLLPSVAQFANLTRQAEKAVFNLRVRRDGVACPLCSLLILHQGHPMRISLHPLPNVKGFPDHPPPFLRDGSFKGFISRVHCSFSSSSACKVSHARLPPHQVP